MAKIDGRALVKDIQSGMSHSELMKKYGLSQEKLKKAFKKLAEERQAREKRIANDVKAKLPDWELMRKYQLTKEGVAFILDRLHREGLVTLEELESRNGGFSDVVFLEMRAQSRYHPTFPAAILVLTSPSMIGKMVNISESGIQIQGVSCQQGETKKIVVLGDDFGEISPFEFEAECCWSKNLGPQEEDTVGFRIIHISEENQRALQQFIREFTTNDEKDKAGAI